MKADLGNDSAQERIFPCIFQDMIIEHYNGGAQMAFTLARNLVRTKSSPRWVRAAEEQI